jgi:hypothetical protein
VTKDATVAEGLDDASVTVTPWAGAVAFSTTVPVDTAPPITFTGFNCTATKLGGRIGSVVDADRPSDALTIADACVGTAVVVTEKFADDAPGLTVTLGGMVIEICDPL